MLLLSVGCEKSNINKVSHKESNKVNQKTYNIYDKQIEQWEYENNTSEYKRECIVAVIDWGIDLKNKYLKKHLWHNSFEKVNNIDDDKNGYDDDIYGYNFIEMSANIQSKNEIDHGTAILVFANGGKLTYVLGTSFAVPYVAKVGAIEYSKQRNIITAREIKKNILKNTIEIKKWEGK